MSRGGLWGLGREGEIQKSRRLESKGGLAVLPSRVYFLLEVSGFLMTFHEVPT